jgi:AraC family transcriptional regulator
MANPSERTLNRFASHYTAARPTDEYRPPAPLHPDLVDCSIVAFSAPAIGTHRSATWPGLRVETVQGMRHTPLEYGFRAPWHILITTEITERHDDKTFVERPPRSALRDFTRTMTFVPSGHGLSGFVKLRTPTRTTYFHIDPRWPLADLQLRSGRIELKPRIFFYDQDLWETTLKLRSQVENPGSMPRQYVEALRVALTHELVRIDSNTSLQRLVHRGGLAVWQQRRVAAYIDEHVADEIPLATLAQLARLSPYHFSRSFKRSFGISPHRYHTNRRIERAKQLLTDGELSVTAIAIDIGFSDTGAFSAAFHKLTGQTPTHYRRNFY